MSPWAQRCTEEAGLGGSQGTWGSRSHPQATPVAQTRGQCLLDTLLPRPPPSVTATPVLSGQALAVPRVQVSRARTLL